MANPVAIFRQPRLSPKYGTPYVMAEIISVERGIHGQWIVTVLLDEVHFESMTYYYTKQEAVAACKAAYGMN